MQNSPNDTDTIAKELAGILQEFRLVSKEIRATKDDELVQSMKGVKAELDEVSALIKDRIGTTSRKSEDRAKVRADVRAKIAAVRAKLNQATAG